MNNQFNIYELIDTICLTVYKLILILCIVNITFRLNDIKNLLEVIVNGGIK